MRNLFIFIFLMLILGLIGCAIVARGSRKTIGNSVARLLVALIPPVSGNLIIIAARTRLGAQIGYYIYFLGMDFVIFRLLMFTFDYCRVDWVNKFVRNLVYTLLIVDVLQYVVNPVLRQAFDVEQILVDDSPYFRLVPYIGQTFHRILDYGILAIILGIFFYKVIRTPRIYQERYSVILCTILLVGIWETYYIFSRTPIDRSMVGFGVFGILVFYFSIYYRPMRLLDRMLAGIASELPMALFFFDAIGRCIWANSRGIELADVKNEDFEPVSDRLYEMFGDFGQKQESLTTMRVVGTGEEARSYVLEKKTVQDQLGNFSGSFLSVRDNTEEQKALQREKYNATHDSLTGLYTREWLYECIRTTLDENPDTRYLVGYIDVNEFKIVNDIFGHEFGDFALTQVSDRIRTILSGRGADILYGRLSGDTFGLFLPVSQFHPDMVEHEMMRLEVQMNGVSHLLQAHMGIYEITEPDLDVSVMFDRARMALLTIKDDYQVHVAYYDDEMRTSVLWSQHISSQLHDALEQGQICPYLQPMVDSSGRVVGAEALVRWIHPTDGFLSPARFIPVFEKNGMIADVDKYMWRSACRILAGWKTENKDLFLSVNISPKDFYFMDVVSELRGIVKEYGIDPSRLRIEITETVMMTDIENRIRILNELRAEGFVVEMDDFGSGYSSLNMLKDMPFDVIKIDMKFLNQTSNDQKAEMILHNVLNMSRDLGVVSLTEGVETESQYRILTEMGCRLFQGYYFAKPMPVDAFEAYCGTNGFEEKDEHK